MSCASRVYILLKFWSALSNVCSFDSTYLVDLIASCIASFKRHVSRSSSLTLPVILLSRCFLRDTPSLLPDVFVLELPLDRQTFEKLALTNLVRISVLLRVLSWVTVLLSFASFLAALFLDLSTYMLSSWS